MSISGVPHRYFDFEAYVTALAFDGAAFAFALGDGTVRLVQGDDAPIAVAAHVGMALDLAAHPGGGFVSGGDDGRFLRIRSDGGVEVLHDAKGRWVERVAASAASGAIACAAGRQAFVWPKGKASPNVLEHDSTVTGLAFDAKGRRLAASRYNGVSLWWTNPETQTAQGLEWKGSHTGVSWHPGGDYVVTAMQENALHGWRLSDKQHMRMAGYPSKIRAMDWTLKGKWLVTAGSEALICWPFEGKGPMGKNAREAGPAGAIVTAVACHPARELIASGHADGSLWLTRFEDDRTTGLRGAGADAVSALKWSGDGRLLAFGTEGGAAGVLNFESVAK